MIPVISFFRSVSTTGWLHAPVAYPSLEMTQQTPPRRRGSYGIDAPYAFAFMAVMTVFVLVLAIISGRGQRFVPVTIMVTFVGLYLDATLRGKFVVWAQLLDSLRLRGDERILDLGCGRGAVLLMAAERLTTGRAVGVDLWQRASLRDGQAHRDER